MHPVDYTLFSTQAEDGEPVYSGDPVKDYYMMVFRKLSIGMGALGLMVGVGALALYKGGMFLWGVRTRKKNLSKQAIMPFQFMGPEPPAGASGSATTAWRVAGAILGFAWPFVLFYWGVFSYRQFKDIQHKAKMGDHGSRQQIETRHEHR